MRPALALLALSLSVSAQAETLKGTLYKQQQCDCCESHADYLRKEGIEIDIEAVSNLNQLSKEAGTPTGFHGCHVIKLNGYIFEGHITSDLIRRVAKEKPDIIGLSFPGMPAGVPGMEGPKKRPIKVYAINKDGTTAVYDTQ